MYFFLLSYLDNFIFIYDFFDVSMGGGGVDPNQNSPPIPGVEPKSCMGTGGDARIIQKKMTSPHPGPRRAPRPSCHHGPGGNFLVCSVLAPLSPDVSLCLCVSVSLCLCAYLRPCGSSVTRLAGF
eukprot:FR740344.1.p1 GENE.FR740344.1~~FR740344.1.p1  ORF type:complete len:125 (-),score=23.28 FR740344.1:236-610(-)